VFRVQYDPLTGNLMGEVLIQSGLRRGSNPAVHPRFDMLTVEALAQRELSRRLVLFSRSPTYNPR